jgi:23S rRNA (adenine2503-C2)-methyltransferase
VLSEQGSADGTTKWLFDVGGGDAVESVFIPEPTRHVVRVVAGGLRGRLPLLLHRPPGFQPQPHHREIVGQLWFAEHHLRAARPPSAGGRQRGDTVSSTTS